MFTPRTFAFLCCASGFAVAQTPPAYLVDTTLDQLFAVDLATGAVTLIGSVLPGPGTCADLAWREDTHELWTLDLGGLGLGTLNTATGAWTAVWPANPTTGWQGFAWDATTRQFFAANQNDTLYRIDPTTGVFTLVGNTAAARLLTGLTVDARGRLLAVDFTSGAIVQLDKNTAAETVLVTAMPNLQGFDVAPDGTWYAVNTTTDSLYTIDQVLGGTTLVGPNTGTQFAKGFQVASTELSRGGAACADGNGSVRRMGWSGSSAIGNTVQMDVDAGSTPMLVLVLLGFSAETFGPLPLPLDLGIVGAPGCQLHIANDLSAGPILSGTGVPVPIPLNPALAGFVWFAQGAVLDSSATPNALGLAFTDFLRVVVTN